VCVDQKGVVLPCFFNRVPFLELNITFAHPSIFQAFELCPKQPLHHPPINIRIQVATHSGGFTFHNSFHYLKAWVVQRLLLPFATLIQFEDLKAIENTFIFMMLF
jgi:hypothetical protein